nr:hypothetical protein [Tanacetum cinerariifolium]
MEDQPLTANAAPTALSLGYVVDFDPEKEEKDPKEDPADYPADRGDNNDDDESSNDDDDDDDVEKDEEDKEEEEHLASADPSDVSTDYLIESLAIARRNLFDDEAPSSNNTGAKPPTPLKTLHEHSYPNSSGFQNPITLSAEQQEESSTCIAYKMMEPQGIHLGYASSISPSKEKRQNGLTEYPQLKSQHGISSCHDSLTTSFQRGWNRIEEYVQYQDDLWDDLSPPMNVSSIVGESETPKPEAPTFTIITRSGVSIRDLPFPTPSEPTPANTEGAAKRKDPRVQSQALHIMKNLSLGHLFSTNPLSHQTTIFVQSEEAKKG